MVCICWRTLIFLSDGVYLLKDPHIFKWWCVFVEGPSQSADESEVEWHDRQEEEADGGRAGTGEDRTREEETRTRRKVKERARAAAGEVAPSEHERESRYWV